jgi:pyruvate dehydrogenase E2 component (dihydrolipoamide acetyltransferase)
MISRVVLAKLSPTMEEGTIVKWAKNEGDAVRVGDVLAEIETDKANMEMEALGGGVLRRILVPAGGKAPVGALIGIVAEPDEDISALLAEQTRAAVPAPPAATPAPPTLSAPPPPVAAPLDAPPAAAGGRIKASPLARAMASARHITLADVKGSGPGGRVIKRDVESQPTASALVPSTPSITPGKTIPLTEMRKVIAKRLSESFYTAPHFFVTLEIDMDAAMTLREQVAKARNVKISVNDLVLKACAHALRAFPAVNARFAGDRIETHADVHIGMAVALPDGLIVPVIRNADRKPLVAIATEARELAARARERRLRPEEYTGSTFTVSNLGMLGITHFTAIINPPESAILAVGAVRLVPVVNGERIRPGQRMNVTLSSDHRAVDGALAAHFLQDLRQSLENPVVLLME